MSGRLLPFLILIGAGIVLFGPSLRVPYTYDDYPHFVYNDRIRHPHSAADIFRNGLQETRPVYNLSLALQARLFGTDPVVAHGINVALHILAAILLFTFLGHLGLGPPPRLLASLLFLVHPITVETVSYFNSRSGLLAFCFSMTALLLVFRTRPSLFAAGLLSLALAMGSKEDAIGTVGLIFLFQWWRHTTLSLTRNLAIASTILVLPVIYLLFRSPHIASVGPTVEAWHSYFLRQGGMIPLHLSLFLFPWPLTFDRDLPAWLLSPTAIASGWIVLGVLLGLAFRFRRSPATLGFLWGVVALFPTHSFIALRDQQSTRLLYPMLPGLSLCAAVWLGSLLESSRRTRAILSILVLLVFAWRTKEEINLWRNPVELWRKNTEAAPTKWRSWLNLGIEYGESGRWTQAQESFERAGRLEPIRPEISYNLGVVWAERTDGQRNLALAHRNLEDALRFDPGHARARWLLDRLEKSKKVLH
ncbi:MAG: tetratricopeptide repeat protein [Pseudomonadota bacterium]